MKLYLRLLLTIPFVIITVCYYKIDNPDETCNSPLSAIIMFVIYCFLLLVGILAVIATFRKRPSDRPTPEPISFSISLITLLFIIYSLTLRGHNSGDVWIETENKNLNDVQESQGLVLRKNATFTFYSNSDCGFSGEYKKIGDTVIFDKKTIDKTNEEMTTVYLLKSNKLIPLFDTANKITFTITNIK